MTTQGSAAVAGGFTGLAIAASRMWNRVSDRSRDARDDARDAQQTANDALERVQSLTGSGDLARLGADSVGDLLAGFAFPLRNPLCPPGAFGTYPAAFVRPTLTEDMAATPQGWPGATGAYDTRGNLEDTSKAWDGQNFGLGIALGFGETRAFLMGLAQQNGASVTQALERQYYRFAQGIALELGALLGPAGAGALTTAQYQAAIHRLLFGTPIPGSAGLMSSRLDFFATNSGVVTNTTAETLLASLKIPAGSFKKVGDFSRVQSSITALGVNSTNTHEFRVRLDNPTSGTVLWDSGAVNPAAGDTGVLNGTAAAQIIGSNGVLVLGGLTELSGTAKGPAVASVSFDTTIDHTLYITAQQSAASAGNQDQARWGEVDLTSTTT